MSRSIKDLLVLSDMDGTLLNSKKELPACNLESIRLFTQLGGRFTVATGRSVESVSRYRQLLELLSPAIACNGGIVYDFKKKAPIVSHQLPLMVARRAVSDVVQMVPGIGVVVLGADFRNYQVLGRSHTQQYFDEEGLRNFVRNPADLPAEWSKVLFCGSSEMIERAYAFVQDQSYPGVYFVPSSRIYLELMPEGITKGSALHELCDILDVSVENTTVIGDYHNDLEMMRQAGHAVAMKNAPAEVRVVADEVCGHHDEGGVGQYLYSLIRQYA